MTCPPPESCVTVYSCGFTTCTVAVAINKQCTTWTAGVFDPRTLCCSGGVGAPAGVFAAVPIATATGNCGWCYGGGGGEH